MEWARPHQAHLLCSGPLWSWLSWCSGNPTEGLVGRGPCLDSPSTGLLPLCWPEGPCSQKPGQTPQVQCAAAVPAPEREESGKGERDVHWAPGMGPPPFSRGLHSPVPGCHRAQHHPEDVSPSLPLPRGARAGSRAEDGRWRSPWPRDTTNPTEMENSCFRFPTDSLS